MSPARRMGPVDRLPAHHPLRHLAITLEKHLLPQPLIQSDNSLRKAQFDELADVPVMLRREPVAGKQGGYGNGRRSIDARLNRDKQPIHHIA
jgi:hypothetical protein